MIEKQAGLKTRPYQIVVGILAVLLLVAPLSSFIVVNGYFNEGGPPGAMVPVVDWLTYRQTGEWIAANTPPDALIGVAEVGQLGFYAERTMTEAGPQVKDRAPYAFRLATARQPSDLEASVLVRQYEAQLAAYRDDVESAKKVLAVGESPVSENLDPAQLAAWTLVANVILNLDETMTKN